MTSPLREKFHSRRGEEWKDCVYKGPYSQIQQCIPQYMHTAKYSWVADVGVMGLIGESFHYGHHVRNCFLVSLISLRVLCLPMGLLRC